MEGQRIEIGVEQALGIGRFMRHRGADLLRDGYVGAFTLIKHGADREFKVEIRIEDSEVDSGECTVAWIDVHGFVERF